jgi:hypothetical protein
VYEFENLFFFPSASRISERQQNVRPPYSLDFLTHVTSYPFSLISFLKEKSKFIKSPRPLSLCMCVYHLILLNVSMIFTKLGMNIVPLETILNS